MIDVKTRSGFECKIDESALDNYEVVEALCDLDNENPLGIVTITRLLLSKKDQKALKDHCRDEHGTARLTAMVEEITDIIYSLNKGKNS